MKFTKANGRTKLFNYETHNNESYSNIYTVAEIQTRTHMLFTFDVTMLCNFDKGFVIRSYCVTVFEVSNNPKKRFRGKSLFSIYTYSAPGQNNWGYTWWNMKIKWTFFGSDLKCNNQNYNGDTAFRTPHSGNSFGILLYNIMQISLTIRIVNFIYTISKLCTFGF